MRRTDQQKVLELQAKIARDNLRDAARALTRALATALARRDYGALGDLVQRIDETCCAITDSLNTVDGGE